MMSLTLAVMCQLYRRHYLEIYDRRFCVKELNSKVQDIRRTLLGRQNNHPQANQFHQYCQGTAGVGVSSARSSQIAAGKRFLENRTTAAILGLACLAR
jgi:hypothetical protein